MSNREAYPAESQNQSIYISLVVFNCFKFDKSLYNKLRKANLIKDDEHKRTACREIYGQYVENLKRTSLIKKFEYLTVEFIVTQLFHVYNLLLKIEMKEIKGSAYEKVANKEIAYAIWERDFTGTSLTEPHILPGLLLMLVDFIKKTNNDEKAINKEIDRLVREEYSLAKKINNQFKELDESQYRNILDNFYVYNWDGQTSKFYYILGAEKILANLEISKEGTIRRKVK